MYGKELILDLYGCNVKKFNRKELTTFFIELCNLIDMEPEDLHFWDYVGEEEEYNKAPDHLKGTSAVQFIKTSNITIHTLDILKMVFLNIFTCKELNEDKAVKFCVDYFSALDYDSQVIDRGERCLNY